MSAIFAALSLLGIGSLGVRLNDRKTASEVRIGLGTATVGFLLARLHLHVFDKIFLRQGQLDRLIDPEPATPPRATDTA